MGPTQLAAQVGSPSEDVFGQLCWLSWERASLHATTRSPAALQFWESLWCSASQEQTLRFCTSILYTIDCWFVGVLNADSCFSSVVWVDTWGRRDARWRRVAWLRLEIVCTEVTIILLRWGPMTIEHPREIPPTGQPMLQYLMKMRMRWELPLFAFTESPWHPWRYVSQASKFPTHHNGPPCNPVSLNVTIKFKVDQGSLSAFTSRHFLLTS